MNDKTRFDDSLNDEIWTADNGSDLPPDEPLRAPPRNKDARRRLDDLLEERRLKRAIEDDYLLD
jgi:hypothetical protein